MKASKGHVGRVFLLRLEEGDAVPACIEQFAADEDIVMAQVILIGGIHDGQVVVGPRHSDRMPPEPVLLPIDGAHEAVGVGVLAPDATGRPVLHMHAALGRSGQTMTGCLRPGVRTWLVGEAVVCELVGPKARRVLSQETGFDLLQITPS